MLLRNWFSLENWCSLRALETCFIPTHGLLLKYLLNQDPSPSQQMVQKQTRSLLGHPCDTCCAHSQLEEAAATRQCHMAGGSEAEFIFETVLNQSSFTKWYCGVTAPVCMLRTWLTLEEWIWEYPIKLPYLKWRNHFGSFSPSCKHESRTNVGHFWTCRCWRCA